MSLILKLFILTGLRAKIPEMKGYHIASFSCNIQIFDFGAKNHEI